MEIKEIITIYLKAICLLLNLKFEELNFSYSEDANNFYCYVNGKKSVISYLIGYKGKNAIAFRKILALLLRKYKILKKVKLIFGKK